MPKANRQTSATEQEAETEISVDLGNNDPKTAVTRRERPRSELAASVNEREEGGNSTEARAWAERNKEVRKRLARQERSFNQRLADQQAEFQRQLTDERARVDKLLLDRGGNDPAAADAAHTQAIAALQAKLEEAIEKGDSKEQAKITVEMTRLDNAYWAKKATQAGVVQRETRTDTKEQRQQQQQPRPGTPTAAGSRFILANEDWWEDPDYEIEKAAAGTIYGKLTKDDGYDANSDDTFKEVGKRLKAKFPNLEVAGVKPKPKPDEDEDEDEDLTDQATRTTRRAATGSMPDRGEANNRNRSQRRTLTQAEIQTMRSVDMDPNNNAHVLRFLREAQAYDAQEA